MTINKQTGEEAAHAFAKIQEMIEKDEIVIFTPSEAKALREVAVLWGHIKSVVVLGSAIGHGLKWLVMIIAIWLGFKSGVLDWIKSNTR